MRRRRIRPPRCRRLLGLGLLLGGLSVALAPPSEAQLSGTVYEDRNGNGAREADEPGLSGVLVSNGREVQATDRAGRYQLPERPGFVAVTTPTGYRAARWYANTPSDFGLVAEPSQANFFFIQVSDSHVYDRVEDFDEFSSPALPWWLPGFVADWLTVLFLDRIYEPAYPAGVGAAMRATLREVARGEGASDEQIAQIEDLGDAASLRAYRAELRREGSPLGDVAGSARRAFGEVAGLGPEFIINTGDLVLEGNAGSAQAMRRWLDFYTSITAPLPMPVYDTIGNNEIAGNQNEEFSPSDKGYGKDSFRSVFGPTHYSFDRGELHFVALDTHTPEPREDEPEWWNYGKMEDSVRAWLEADLEASRGRVPVVLNHEPFRIDPAWPLPDLEPADDEGLLERFAVPYTLTGHVHFNGLVREGPTTHLTTGALSGMRWILPAAVHPRGYRLFWAQGPDLHSAWKPLGERVVALAEGALTEDAWVIVAADAGGPFERIGISSGGTPLPADRWGAYFLRVPKRESEEALTVDTVSIDGERSSVTLALPAEAGPGESARASAR